MEAFSCSTAANSRTTARFVLAAATSAAILWASAISWCSSAALSAGPSESSWSAFFSSADLPSRCAWKLAVSSSCLASRCAESSIVAGNAMAAPFASWAAAIIAFTSARSCSRRRRAAASSSRSFAMAISSCACIRSSSAAELSAAELASPTLPGSSSRCARRLRMRSARAFRLALLSSSISFLSFSRCRAMSAFTSPTSSAFACASLSAVCRIASRLRFASSIAVFSRSTSAFSASWTWSAAAACISASSCLRSSASFASCSARSSP